MSPAGLKTGGTGPIGRDGFPAPGALRAAGIKKFFSFSKILFDNCVFYDMIEAEHRRGERRDHINEK